MGKNINFEAGQLRQAVGAQQQGDQTAAEQAVDNLLLEGDPEVIAELQRQLGITTQ